MGSDVLWVYGCISYFFFFFKQKTAYEIGTGDWSSDVCSSDLIGFPHGSVLRNFWATVYVTRSLFHIFAE